MIGRTLKNYVVEEQLGKGGMGVVYRARDTRLERRVALKALPPELMRDEERRRRFVQEARAASAVTHPAIAPIYEIADDGDVTFIVMEYVDGSTLRTLIARGELDVAAAIEIGIQVAEGLATAHAAGIVHRDIKSDNIMVTNDGHPKILDFGLAKLIDLTTGDSDPARLETMALTHAGVVMGTVAYMSPEQARGLAADHRSDMFSFGVVLYEMATGKLPFHGQSALDTMHAIAFQQTALISTLRAGLPYSLQSVVDRCLQKKPDDRYPSMRDVATNLRVVRRELESGVTGGRPLMDRARAWFRGLTTRGTIFVGIAGFALGAFLVGVVLRKGEFNLGPFFALLFFAAIFYRRFRNRRANAVSKFARRAGKLPEVRVVTYDGTRITVVVERPTAKTYVKLNSLLSSANGGILHGPPFTLSVRENVSVDERVSMLSSAGLQYAAE